MKYRVELTPSARDDLNMAYRYAARKAPESAKRWIHRFRSALFSLETQPRRCGFAPERRLLRRELRQLLFGRRQYKFRAIFYINGDLVRVLRIRRASMQPLRRIVLEEADSDDLN